MSLSVSGLEGFAMASGAEASTRNRSFGCQGQDRLAGGSTCRQNWAECYGSWNVQPGIQTRTSGATGDKGHGGLQGGHGSTRTLLQGHVVSLHAEQFPRGNL